MNFFNITIPDADGNDRELMVEIDSWPASGDGWNEPLDPAGFEVVAAYEDGVLIETDKSDDVLIREAIEERSAELERERCER